MVSVVLVLDWRGYHGAGVRSAWLAWYLCGVSVALALLSLAIGLLLV